MTAVASVGAAAVKVALASGFKLGKKSTRSLSKRSVPKKFD
jgi:hypothetical protein